MKNTQTFIELTLEGGWKHVVSGGHFKGGVFKPTTYEEVERWFEKHPQLILLDPLAWAAVGKAKGWEKEVRACWGTGCGALRKGWHQKMVDFLKLLAEGKDIETALGEILN